MADLNALIAQGVQFKAPPDPFAQYAQMQQLEQGQQANQLNRMKMDEYRRGLAEQNQLRQLDPAAADYLTQVTRVNPKLGFEFGKAQNEAANAKLTQQKTQMELSKAKRDFIQQVQRDTSRNPSDANITAFKEDLMANPMFTEQEKAQMAAGADRILAMPLAERQAFMSSQGASASELKPTLTPQTLGGSVQILSTPAYGGQSSVVPGSQQQVTITPGQAEANRLAEQRIAQGDRRIEIAEQRMADAAGPKPLALKQVPVHAQKAILGAATSVKKIDDAIKALEASTDATGYKGYLPNVILNRAYPQGTEARAGLADVGSLLIHDRSGAAVTVSETPRLLPFVPQITDDKSTALKKLKRLKQIQLDEAEALAGTYTPEQGFNEFKPGAITPTVPTAPPASNGLTPEEQAELEALRKKFPRGGK